MNIGHGFLSNLLLIFSNYDALLYIFVLSNYFCKYKNKNIFEKVTINMQTSSVMVCIQMNSSFLRGRPNTTRFQRWPPDFCRIFAGLLFFKIRWSPADILDLEQSRKLTQWSPDDCRRETVRPPADFILK